ncbi:hypothetical protein [Mycobacteroides franklinii]
MHSLTTAGRTGLTAGESVISYRAGGGEETGFVAPPQGSHVWRTKL